MSNSEHTVRIFISSTFIDMHNERDIIIKQVIPSLQEKCRDINVRIIPIDLRWGITQEEAENGKVLEICLDEIDRARPLFIGLIGERYGWIPEVIDINNRIKYKWIEQRAQHKISMTELEIIYGVLENKKQIPYSFFYLRDSSFVDEIPFNFRDDFMSESSSSTLKLKTLKKKIKNTYKKFPHNIKTYQCKFSGILIDKEMLLKKSQNPFFFDKIIDNELIDNTEMSKLNKEEQLFFRKNSKVILKELENFSKTVEEDLLRAIKKQFPISKETKDLIEKEIIKHHDFQYNISRFVVGNSPIINKVKEWIYTENKHQTPLMILGKSGEGKTTTISKVMELIKNDMDLILIPVFIGLTENSKSITDVYKIIATQINSSCLTNLNMNLTSHHRFFNLFYIINEAIRSIALKKKLVIFIDNIDGIQDGYEMVDFSSLPQGTTPNIRLIFTANIDGRANSARQMRKFPAIKMDSLALEEGSLLVRNILEEYGKKLNKEQMKLIFNKTESNNPLYLSLIAHEIRVYHSYDMLTDKIKALPENLDFLLVYLIKQIESFFGKDNTSVILSYISITEKGEYEEYSMINMLETCMGKKVEPILWAQLWRHVTVFLNSGDLSNVILFPLHKSIIKSINEFYFSNKNISIVNLLHDNILHTIRDAGLVKEIKNNNKKGLFALDGITYRTCGVVNNNVSLLKLYNQFELYLDICREVLKNKSMSIVMYGEKAKYELNLFYATEKNLALMEYLSFGISSLWADGSMQESIIDKWLFLNKKYITVIQEYKEVLSGNLTKKAIAKSIQNRGHEWY